MESYCNIWNISLDGFDVWFTVFQSVLTKKIITYLVLGLGEVNKIEIHQIANLNKVLPTYFTLNPCPRQLQCLSAVLCTQKE